MNSAENIWDRLAESSHNLPNLFVVDQNWKPGDWSGATEADISEVFENRLSVRCKVSNPSGRLPSVVAFARQYYPGYRAFLNGNELPVKAMNVFQAAVIVPPRGTGELRLVFAPKSLIITCGFALSGVLVIAGFLIGPLVMGRSVARRARDKTSPP